MLLLVMLASYQAEVMKEFGGGGGGAPPPQHMQDLNMNTNTNVDSSRSVTASSAGASAPMRFTALHVTMIFIAILLCVVICAIPWDNFKCRNNSSANNNNSTTNPEHSNSSATDEEEARQLGLSKKMIKSFQLVRYGASSLREKAEQQQEEGGVGGGGGSCWTECMICLSDFRNGQMVRILPHCNHGFHKKCIDQWLLSHTSCPICRNVLLVLNSPEKAFPPPAPPTTPPPRHLHHSSDQVDDRQHESQSQSHRAADPTPDIGETHDEDPPVNHQDYHQSVYTTYIVISD